ncbi:hypothetical protein [Levilactobacillus namurensis]|uniref:hypothetical protein n=1 Tax=Levilactobacillus namurensis TaxID=380393 RepID=UPI00223130FE|nr:hypothetical protein [Levilactobacillus namurensis]MCW3778497.1 hypothetical protein [Levilactobacillus namurensis]MDT7019582.1 hypothetical protein [Levilactobacillus namurensis]WNN65831.1 hypothetical protein RIN67_01695 [Levilactobacillus namurensis]
MNEMKDNSVKFYGTIANMTNKSRKDGKVTVLRIETPSQDLRGQMEALANSVDDSVEITVTPNQTELDTDEDGEDNPDQTELDVD